MPEIDLPQGIVRVTDSGTGAPVVLMHGLLVDGKLWRDVLPALTAEARAIVPDLPLGSHRRAMRTDADLTPPGLARMVADLMTELDLRDVTLVGNDTGGAIAQIVAAHHPERLGCLVLTNCDAYENFLPPAFRPLQWIAHVPPVATALLQATRIRAVRQFGYSMTAKRLDDRPRGWTEPSLVDADVRRDLFKVLRGIDPRHTLEAARRLRELDRPALLAWAYEDRFFKSAFAERLAGDLRNARIERIADSRTFVPIDQPARLAELIREFMHETGAGTDGPRSVATAER